jgi:hypothetical protein
VLEKSEKRKIRVMQKSQLQLEMAEFSESEAASLLNLQVKGYLSQAETYLGQTEIQMARQKIQQVYGLIKAYNSWHNPGIKWGIPRDNGGFDQAHFGVATLLLAHIYVLEEQPVAANNFFRDAIHNLQQEGTSTQLGHAYYTYGHFLLGQERFSEARYYLQIACETSASFVVTSN